LCTHDLPVYCREHTRSTCPHSVGSLSSSAADMIDAHTYIRMLPVLWARGGSKFSDKQFTPSEGRAHAFDQSCIIYFVFFFFIPRAFLLSSFLFFIFHTHTHIILILTFSQVFVRSITVYYNDTGGRRGLLYTRWRQTSSVCRHCHLYTISRCTAYECWR